MKVRTKLSIALGLPVLLLVGSLVYHVRTLQQSVSTSFELSAISERIFLSSSTQIRLLNQLEENAEKYWITTDTGYLAKFRESRTEFDNSMERVKGLDMSAEERAAVHELSAEWRRFQPIADWIDADHVRGEVLVTHSLPLLRDRLAGVRWRVRLVSDASQRVMAEQLNRAAARALRGERLSWAVAVVSLLLSLAISVGMIRSISGALRRLKGGTRAVAGGDFEHRLPVESDDELAHLAGDFNIMTRRLGELERTKQHFLSSVSHDLKTPLASIQETNRILLDEVPGPLSANQRQLLELSLQSGERLFSMIADLLDLSSMEAGAFRLEREVHDIGQLVRRSVEQMEPIAGERAVRLITELPTLPLLVDCDGARLTQVLVNLLSNAIKFSPAAEDVRVSVHRFSASREQTDGSARRSGTPRPPAADSAVICVSDRGPGVPEAEREIIFRRFVQTEVGRSVRGRGVGLGLAICREIISAHGGRIWAEASPTGGSRFLFILPGAVPRTLPVRPIPAAAAAHT